MDHDAMWGGGEFDVMDVCGGKARDTYYHIQSKTVHGFRDFCLVSVLYQSLEK